MSWQYCNGDSQDPYYSCIVLGIPLEEVDCVQGGQYSIAYHDNKSHIMTKYDLTFRLEAD